MKWQLPTLPSWPVFPAPGSFPGGGSVCGRRAPQPVPRGRMRDGRPRLQAGPKNVAEQNRYLRRWEGTRKPPYRSPRQILLLIWNRHILPGMTGGSHQQPAETGFHPTVGRRGPDGALGQRDAPSAQWQEIWYLSAERTVSSPPYVPKLLG